MAAVAAGLALGWLCWGGESVGRAQTAPANLSPALLDVVKLAQAHLPDDIIMAQIKNSGVSYSLSADDILYLNSQGVSAPVISLLQQMKPAAPTMPSGPAPTPPPDAPTMPAPYGASTQPPPEAYVPPVAPPGSDINLVYFQNQLQPFGHWLDVPPYGPAWQPNEAVLPGWRPYFNDGNWQYTDAGWFWHSAVPYGDIVFHYGRWMRDFRYGWVWVPGYDWAPAWVSWRHADGFAGWAPLPPAARFEVGVGLFFRGGLAVDVDFGLAPDDYMFVGYDHFWDHDYRPFLLPRERVGLVFRTSLVMNDHRIVDGRLVFEGPGRERVAAFTHREVVVEKVVIRDPRIEHGREMERTRTVERVKEIQSRPPSDPLRRNMEKAAAVAKPADARGPAGARGPADARGRMDVRGPADTRGPADARRGGPIPSAAPERGGPGARNPEPGTRGGPAAPASRDTKESTNAPGGRGGR